MNLDSTAIGQTLSFTTVSGEKLNNLKFVSILDAATVDALGQDPAARHKQYLPFMADPKPLMYTDYLYAKFVNADGLSAYIGIPWITPTSIVVNDTVVYLLTLKNTTPDAIASVKQMLLMSGIEDFTVVIQ